MMREELNQIGFNLNSDASTSELVGSHSAAYSFSDALADTA